jgi:hypothetical protein
LLFETLKSTRFCSAQDHQLDSYLNNPRKISKFCNRVEDYVQRNREFYLQSFKGRYYPTPLDKIQQLPNCSLRISKLSKSSPGAKNIFYARKGCWEIRLNKLTEENRRDFTVNVAAAYNRGYIYRFLPEVIEQDLTSRFGRDVYLDWKRAVLGDIQSLRDLVGVARKKITRVVPSVTCSERSARLCEKVGIPVKGDIAFLIPDHNGF